MDEDIEAQRTALSEALARLPTARLKVATAIMEGLGAKLEARADPASDFANDVFVQALGELLLVHHSVSRENFSKDKFEYGMETALRRVDIPAALAAKGNPGHDITVRNERWSLKTQYNREIKPDHILITKFMELGKGQWVTPEDLEGLRDRMLAHMEGYDRIFTLRTLSAARNAARFPFHYYELVEIPKVLLLKAAGVKCVMHKHSKQTPPPGSCTVIEDGFTLFELCFDGGTERKLKVNRLAKSACHVHATWQFPRVALPA